MHSSHLSCSAVLCSDPVDINNGMVTFNGTSINDTATYSCDSGFELIGLATTTCTLVEANSAIFQPEPPLCRREYCMNVTGVAAYTFFSKLCVNHNWNEDFSQCIHDIVYNTLLEVYEDSFHLFTIDNLSVNTHLHVSCSAALCADPVDTDNGMVTFTGNSVGDTANYSCDSGFELIGLATAICTLVEPNFAIFDLEPPFCRREYYIM